MTAFHNRVRLPIRLFKPQFPETRNVYRTAGGETITQSVVMRKTYQLQTDYMSERLHERTTIALSHDDVQIEAPNFYGSLAKSGDYQITWPDFMAYPYGMAAAELEVTPFDVTNSNCATCDEATQVDAMDDTFPANLTSNANVTLDLYDNDNICCAPVTWSLVTFNADIFDSASIDADGIFHGHVKTGQKTQNSLKVATYRATCPNGAYDDADIFANITGDTPTCLAPRGVTITSFNATEIYYTFLHPIPDVASFEYILFNNTRNVNELTGTLTNLQYSGHFTGRHPAEKYTLMIRSVCSPTNKSNYAQAVVTLAKAQSATCGGYRLQYIDSITNAPDKVIQYTDCNGAIAQTNVSPKGTYRDICAMQTSPGVPTSMHAVSGGGTGYYSQIYTGLC